jgi:hypothetical protein
MSETDIEDDLARYLQQTSMGSCDHCSVVNYPMIVEGCSDDC